MIKQLSLLPVLCFVLLSACRKENVTAENSTASATSTAADAAARSAVFVKAIQPFSDSVTGGDSFPVTVVLNKPAPAGGFQAYVTTARPTGPIADVPAYVTIPEGQSAGTITVHTIPVRATEIEVFFAGPASNGVGLEYLIAILPRPVNDPRPALQFLEAENAVLTGAHAVFGGESYFSNGGFAAYDKTSGGSVQFKFNIEKAGNYFLVLKYATPFKFNLEKVTMKVALNGLATATDFPFTANETATQIVNTIQYLKKGMNDVTVTSIGKGSERLDYLEVAAK